MTRRRDGFGILAVAIALAFGAMLMAMAAHTLWRGSSKNLFSVQENRVLSNLGRSAISEAVYKIQTQLEQGSSAWIDWCTTPAPAKERTFEPKWTREYARQMTSDPRFLEYRASAVTVRRLAGVSLAAGLSGRLGVLDFVVTCDVVRASPRHASTVTLTERRAFYFSDAETPFRSAGRHIELLATPVATFLEYP